MSVIPVIDIGGWFAGHQAARDEVAAALDDACRNTGFMQVVGHGLPSELLSRARAAMDEFFALPDADKLALRPPSPEINRGYAPRRSESLGYSLGEARPADLVEAFVVGDDRIVEGDPYFEAQRDRAFAPNIWPHLETFRRDIWDYFLAARGLSRVLCDIAGRALRLPPDFFRSRTDRAINAMRLNWYERRAYDPPLVDTQLGLGAHTDYGILTVLLADPAAGLQVLARDGQWLDVMPLADGLVVNTGDALAVWTNDEWTSTIHRVLPPPAGGPRRRSIAFFQDGNYDVSIECLPSCTSADRPARYLPVTLGEHVQSKIRGGRSLTTDLQSAVQTTSGRVAGPPSS